MQLKKLEYDLTVCKLPDTAGIDLTNEFYFIGRTDEEISLAPGQSPVPSNLSPHPSAAFRADRNPLWPHVPLAVSQGRG